MQSGPAIGAGMTRWLLALGLATAFGCGELAEAPSAGDAGADAAHDAQKDVGLDAAVCPSDVTWPLFGDAAPSWANCQCPDTGCPGTSVCVLFHVPEGPHLPLGCAPVPAPCIHHQPMCECMAEACGKMGCVDNEAALMCN
jgi:hypothetical protein